MSEPEGLEARVAAVERRVEEVASDAAAARHLAAARDRDLGDLTAKVESNRAAINALGVQTAARFDRLEGRFDHLEGRFDHLEGRFDELQGRFDRLESEVGRGFAEMRGRLDETAAGQQRIAELITRALGPE